MHAKGMLFFLLLIGVVLLPLPPIAQAHALLVRSDPAGNAVLKTPPSEVRLWFSEALDVQFSRVSVFDSQRMRVDGAEGKVFSPDSGQLMIPLRPLADGTYTIVWSVVSLVDGHRGAGVLVFTVGERKSNASANDQAIEGGIANGFSNAVPVATNWLSFLSLATILGILSHSQPVRTLSSPSERNNSSDVEACRRRERFISSAVAIYILAAVTACLFRSASIADLPIWEVARQPSMALSILSTRYGAITFFRLILALALLTLLYPRSKGAASHQVETLQQTPRRRERAALILATLGIASYAITGHAAAKGFGLDSNLPVIADALHLLAMAAWLGGLFHFSLLLLPQISLAEDSEQIGLLRRFLKRFSPMALICFIVLLGSGAFSAVQQVTAPSDLLNSTYGVVLAGKHALIIGLLVTAVLVQHAWQRVNARQMKVPAIVGLGASGNLSFASEKPAGSVGQVAIARLVLATRTEAILAGLILLAAAILMEMPPPIQTSAEPLPNSYTTVVLSDVAKAGRALYFSKGCVTCHGEDARGTDVATFWLAGLAPQRIEAAIRVPPPELKIHLYSQEQLGNDELRKIIAFTEEIPPPKLVDDLGVFLDVSPGQPGINTFDAYVIAAKNGIAMKNVDRVIIKYANLDLATSSASEVARSQGNGHYQANLNLSLPGTWQVNVVVRRKAFLRDTVATFGFVVSERGVFSQRLVYTEQQLGDLWATITVLGVEENEIYLSMNDEEGNPAADLTDLVLQSLSQKTTPGLGPLAPETVEPGRFVAKGKFFSGSEWWIIRVGWRRAGANQSADFSFYVRPRDILLQNPYGAHH